MSVTLALKSMFIGQPSNEKLMLHYAKSGDNAVLDRLYDSCGDDLYHFLLTLSDHTLAKDISQKTWLKVMEKKHLYRDSGQFKAWLFTLARNQLIDEFRQHKNHLENTELLHANDSPLEQHAYQADIHQQFDLALLSLPFEQREAFCLQQEGFSLQNIATITHSAQETVKSRIRYAKDNLRKKLIDKFENDHE